MNNSMNIYRRTT